MTVVTPVAKFRTTVATGKASPSTTNNFTSPRIEDSDIAVARAGDSMTSTPVRTEAGHPQNLDKSGLSGGKDNDVERSANGKGCHLWFIALNLTKQTFIFY